MQLSFSLLPILVLPIAAESICYYPDASVATGHIPCNTTASDTPTDASACCFGYGNDYCLANGLCLFGGILVRASCTDKNWASPSCAQWCLEEQRNTSMNIFPCHEQGVWQCEWHEDCTSNFTLQTSEIAVIIRDDQQPNAQHAIEFGDVNAKFVAVNQTTSSSAATTTSNSPSTSSATSSNPASTVSTTAATASSLPANLSSTPTSTPATPSTLSAGAKAGIAVGAITGFLIIGTFSYVLFVRRRRHKVGNGHTITDHKCVHCGYGRAELAGQPARMEMDATSIKPEMAAQTPGWEMDEGRRGVGLDRYGF